MKMIFLLFVTMVFLLGCKGESDSSTGSGYKPPANNPVSAPISSATPGGPGKNPTIPSGPPKSPSNQHSLQVLEVRPKVGAVVSIDQAFEVVFNRDIDGGTVIANSELDIDTVSLETSSGGVTVLSLISTNVNGNSIHIRPQHDLAGATTYTLKISGDLADTAGVRLSQGVSYSFKTADEVSTNPGSVVHLSWFQEGFTDPETSDIIDRFMLSFGRKSRTDADLEAAYEHELKVAEIPELNGAFSGRQDFTAQVAFSFNPTERYYFRMRACTVNNICSDESNEIYYDF